MLKIKRILKLYNSEEKFIIQTMINALKYCQTAIEYTKEHGCTFDKDSFFYHQGLCYNVNKYMLDVLPKGKFYEYREFISYNLDYAMTKYSHYSGNKIYPIASPIKTLTPEEYFHLHENKYTKENAEIRYKLASELIATLEKMI